MKESSRCFLPGSTLGILGGGQLGRMLALVARRLGYGVVVYTPTGNSPAGAVADLEIVAAYEDVAALRDFASRVDVVTIEFENIPVAALQCLETSVAVYPQPHVLDVAQHRLREKTFLTEQSIPVTPFAAIYQEADLLGAAERVGFPAVLKTAGSGYDGKGQQQVQDLEDLQAAYAALGESVCVLESFVDLEREISVIAARSDTGAFEAYRPVENQHRNHILDVTVAPAGISETLERQAIAVTQRIMDAFSMRGILCVEFFVTRGGALLVNELAPRTHNSGHYTIEAAVCCQFEQHLRSVCGLPLGDPTLRQPAAMVNLLGDIWANGTPNWPACLSLPSTYLHLYGKSTPAPARKMGHITTLASTSELALSMAKEARQSLLS